MIFIHLKVFIKKFYLTHLIFFKGAILKTLQGLRKPLRRSNSDVNSLKKKAFTTFSLFLMNLSLGILSIKWGKIWITSDTFYGQLWWTAYALRNCSFAQQLFTEMYTAFKGIMPKIFWVRARTLYTYRESSQKTSHWYCNFNPPTRLNGCGMHDILAKTSSCIFFFCLKTLKLFKMYR